MVDMNYTVYNSKPSSPQPNPFPLSFTNAYSYPQVSPSTSSTDNTKHTEKKVKLSDADLWQYVTIRTHPNGGASAIHLDQKEVEFLSSEDIGRLSDLFLKETFREETEGVPCHVMGIVHNAVCYLPELVSHFAETHSDVVVKMGNLRNSSIETTTFADFANKVRNSYSSGTFRCGPLLQVSLVGQVSEETGRYFPDFLGKSIYIYIKLISSSKHQTIHTSSIYEPIHYHSN